MKKILSKYWMALFALVLLAAAACVVFLMYRPEEAEFESERDMLNGSVTLLQEQIVRNNMYAGVQDQLEGETEALATSRAELYQNFPSELKQEDQILYGMYLEKMFGDDVILMFSGNAFHFGTESDLAVLSDGAKLKTLTITVSYETTYKGFKNMIDRLATDDTYITSVQNCTLDYDDEADIARGTLTLQVYLLDYGQGYEEPNPGETTTGKPNIFD